MDSTNPHSIHLLTLLILLISTVICSTSADCGGFECDACGFCQCNDTRFGNNCQCAINDGTCPLGTNPNTTMMEQCSGTGRLILCAVWNLHEWYVEVVEEAERARVSG